MAGRAPRGAAAVAEMTARTRATTLDVDEATPHATTPRPSAGAAPSTPSGAVCFAISAFALVTILTRSLGARGAGAFLESVAVFSIVTRTVGARRRPRPRALRRPATGASAAPARPADARRRAGARRRRRRADRRGRSCSSRPDRSAASSATPAPTDQVATYLRLLAPFIPVAAVYMTLDGCAQGFGTMVPSVVVERIGRPLLVALLVLGVVDRRHRAPAALALSWATSRGRSASSPRRSGSPGCSRRAERRRPGEPHLDRRTLARRFWRFSIPRSLGALLQMGILWADTLLLGALASTKEAGVYAAVHPLPDRRDVRGHGDHHRLRPADQPAARLGASALGPTPCSRPRRCGSSCSPGRST